MFHGSTYLNFAEDFHFGLTLDLGDSVRHGAMAATCSWMPACTRRLHRRRHFFSHELKNTFQYISILQSLIQYISIYFNEISWSICQKIKTKLTELNSMRHNYTINLRHVHLTDSSVKDLQLRHLQPKMAGQSQSSKGKPSQSQAWFLSAEKGSFFACWACWWFPWTSSSTRNRIRVHMSAHGSFHICLPLQQHPVSELAHQHRVEWSTAQCQDCMASTLLEICAKKMQYWLCCSSLIHSYWVVLPNSSLTCKKLFVCSHKVTKQELAKGWWMQWRPSIYIHFSTCLYRVACGTRSLSSLPAEAGIQSKPGWASIGIGWGPIDPSLDPHWCIILLYSAESGWDGWAWRCLNVLWFQAGPVPKLREKAAWVVSNVVSCCACWSCEAVNLRPT